MNLKSFFLRVWKSFFWRLWRWVAKGVHPHLSVIPLFWGDYYIGNRDRVKIGKNCSVANAIFNSRSGDITLEDNVFFGHNVMLLTGTHDCRHRGAKRHGDASVPHSGRDIVVKNGAFIASGVIVIGPSVIGEDAVVCAGSIVRGDLPSGYICAGNPARPIREIEFYDSQP